MATADNLFSSTLSSLSEHTLAEVIASYLVYYGGVSSHTARAKRVDLRHFQDYLGQKLGGISKAKIPLSAWNASHVEAFLESRLQRGERPATVARRLATLKHFGRTLAERVPGFINPARDVRAPKHNPLRPKALPSSERELVRARARNRCSEKPSFGRLRNLMILDLMLDTGLRADEVRLLRRHQLDMEGCWLKQVRTKGRRFRNVYLPTTVRAKLKDYLAAREIELRRYVSKLSLKLDAALPLFISGYNANPDNPESFLLGTKTLWRAIRELSAETKLHPHLLRHSFAVDLLDDSGDIRLVSQALGHSDVRTTMRYTEREDERLAVFIEGMRGKK